jgi:hypothetical protein
MTLISSFEFSFSYFRVMIVDAENVESASTLKFTEQHYRQGFAWSPYEIDYMIDCSEDLEAYSGSFEIHLSEVIDILPSTTRAILLPFTVGSKGIILSDPVGSSLKFSIPVGDYALVFEFKPRDDLEYINSAAYEEDVSSGLVQIWGRFTFVPQQNVEPAILKADEFIDATYPLLMEADPV